MVLVIFRDRKKTSNHYTFHYTPDILTHSAGDLPHSLLTLAYRSHFIFNFLQSLLELLVCLIYLLLEFSPHCSNLTVYLY